MIFPAQRSPKDHDIRIRRVFALWPKRIETERECVVVWLQYYYVKEEYRDHPYAGWAMWHFRDTATERGWLEDKPR